MNLVIEGPDASGKSTLARYLSNALHRPIVHSPGPEKYPGEVNERIREWAKFERVIFDRHPVVSQYIYSHFNGTTPVDERLSFDFYESRPLIIFCTTRIELPHKEKAHDSPENLKVITDHADGIKRRYNEWALDHSHMIFRPGMEMKSALAAIRGFIGE